MKYFISLVIAVLLSGCTYSKPKTRVRILPVYLYLNNSSFFTIVYKEVYQKPSGIATFPNGGKIKINSQILYFYLCNKKEKVCKQTGKFSKKDLTDKVLLEDKYNINLYSSDPILLYTDKLKNIENIYMVLESQVKNGILKWKLKNNIASNQVNIIQEFPKKLYRNSDIKVNYKLSIYPRKIKIAQKNTTFKEYKTIFVLDENSSKIVSKH